MNWCAEMLMRGQAVAGGIFAIMTIALTACGDEGSVREKQASNVQREKEANKVHHIPEDSETYEGEPLPPGPYVTEEFKPKMSFDLETGWARGGTELRDAWDIRDIRIDANWLGFLNAEEVYKPNRSGGLKVAPAPRNMIAWIQTNAFLDTNKPKGVSVGGERECR